MITIFSTPKNFEGIFDIIQKNAINSWRALGNDIEIIIFGDSKGAKEIAENFAAIYIPIVKKSSNGVPILSDLFAQAEEIAKYKILTFINADIMLPFNFIDIFKKIEIRFKKFLMVGYRWDLEIKEEINFEKINDIQVFWKNLLINAKKHPSSGIDFFIFKKKTFRSLPDFIIGRPGYDNWLIWYARRRLIPVVDISNKIRVIHQNHHFNFHNVNKDPKIHLEEDGLENKRLAEDNYLNLKDANYEIIDDKIIKKEKYDFKNRNLGRLEIIYPELYYFFSFYKRLIRRFNKYN